MYPWIIQLVPFHHIFFVSREYSMKCNGNKYFFIYLTGKWIRVLKQRYMLPQRICWLCHIDNCCTNPQIDIVTFFCAIFLFNIEDIRSIRIQTQYNSTFSYKLQYKKSLNKYSLFFFHPRLTSRNGHHELQRSIHIFKM